jgi:hypothetical protein
VIPPASALARIHPPIVGWSPPRTPSPALPAPDRHPLALFFALVPQAGEGATLADKLFRYLRLRNTEAEDLGQGLPIRYLTDPKQLTAAHEAVGVSCDTAVLVVFFDDEMLVDPDWRKALNEVHGKDGTFWVYPVMISAHLARLQPFASRFDPVRIFNSRDTAENRDTQRFGRLRRGVLDQLLRHVDDPFRSAAHPPARLAPGEDDRLKVFLSHAKADGEDVAIAIRDGLSSAGRIRSWFDQQDLRAGMPADEDMTVAARESSGGIIAVLSAKYPQRPWCWREASVARTPRQVPVTSNGNTVWVAQAGVVVLLPGSQFSQGVPALNRLPQIGWCSPDEEPKERVAEIVDRLYLELIRSRLARRRAHRLAQTAQGPFLFTDFVPDAWSLAHLAPHLRGQDPKPTLVYPGHGLREAERRELHDLSKKLDIQPPMPYEQLAIPAPDAPPSGSPIMAISAGGDVDELRKSGSSVVLVDELMLRLGRGLLQRGWRLAYGGNLRPGKTTQEINLTETIVQEAEAWFNHTTEAGNGEPPAPPLINYVACRDDTLYTTAWKAKVFGVVELRFTQSEPTASPLRVAPYRATDPVGSVPGDDYSWMRIVQAKQTTARICMGGKVKGSSGRMPGILEEVLVSIQANKPFVLLGGFGGCAAVLARFLEGMDRPWPDALAPVRELRVYDDPRVVEPQGVVDVLRKWRDETLHGQAKVCGLPREDWLEIMRETDLDHAVTRVLGWARELGHVG